MHENEIHMISIIILRLCELYVTRGCFVFRAVCEDKFGYAPEIRILGHVNATFPYIPPPLDYILVEVLKNALR